MSDIRVSYDQEDINNALKQIINHPNVEELIKLLSPSIIANSKITGHFVKLLIGNKLPEIIEPGTICKINIDDLGHSYNRKNIQAKYLDELGNILVIIDRFLGYSQYYDYQILVINVTNTGVKQKEFIEVKRKSLEIFQEF